MLLYYELNNCFYNNFKLHIILLFIQFINYDSNLFALKYGKFTILC